MIRRPRWESRWGTSCGSERVGLSLSPLACFRPLICSCLSRDEHICLQTSFTGSFSPAELAMLRASPSGPFGAGSETTPHQLSLSQMTRIQEKQLSTLCLYKLLEHSVSPPQRLLLWSLNSLFRFLRRETDLSLLAPNSREHTSSPSTHC